MAGIATLIKRLHHKLSMCTGGYDGYFKHGQGGSAAAAAAAASSGIGLLFARKQCASLCTQVTSLQMMISADDAQASLPLLVTVDCIVLKTAAQLRRHGMSVHASIHSLATTAVCAWRAGCAAVVMTVCSFVLQMTMTTDMGTTTTTAMAGATTVMSTATTTTLAGLHLRLQLPLADAC